MKHGAFDHHSQDFALNWRAAYGQILAAGVARSESNCGFWLVSRHRDVQAVLMDPKRFSSARAEAVAAPLARGVTIPPTGSRIGFMEMDPPRSTALRKLMSPWFSQAAVDGARDRIRQISAWVIDGVIAQGACDVVADLARPVPALLILDSLGLPLDRWQRYSDTLHAAVVRAPGSRAGMAGLMADLKTIGATGAYHPAGLFAALLQADIDGARLGIDMVVELVMMLLFGGTDTTVSTIASLMLHLATHPHDRQALIDTPALIPRAVEEILRFYPPSMSTARTVTSAACIDGVHMQPGDRVLCAIAGANTDDTQFERAGEFDVTRERNPHMAFGRGIHSCLGQHLARADAQIFLQELLTRLPDFTIDTTQVVACDDRALVHGYAAMPVRFPAVGRSAAGRGAFPELTGRRLQPG